MSVDEARIIHEACEDLMSLADAIAHRTKPDQEDRKAVIAMIEANARTISALIEHQQLEIPVQIRLSVTFALLLEKVKDLKS